MWQALVVLGLVGFALWSLIRPAPPSDGSDEDCFGPY